MKELNFYTLSLVSSIMKQEKDRGRLKDSSYPLGIQVAKKKINKMKKLESKQLELKKPESKQSESKIISIKDEINKLKKDIKDLGVIKGIKDIKDVEVIKEIKDINDADELTHKYNELIEKYYQELFNNISKGKHRIEVKVQPINGKEIFITKENESMVISKIISQELARRYRVKPADRNTIIEGLIAILNNPMPKIVIRADVKDFYESIPQNKLMTKLKKDGFTSKRTIKYLESFLYQYDLIKKNGIGIPRGLSFSAYLSEIYLTSIDKIIGQISGIYFYKRYVDDIVIVANPQIKSVKDYWKELNDSFTAYELELHHDSSKRYMSILNAQSKDEHFEYLGYKFLYDKGLLRVLLSDHRIKKYEDTISALFDAYSRSASSRKYKKTKDDADRRRDALRVLMDRLRVLTSNGLLSGRNSFVATGIYYTNKYLTDCSQLQQLDKYLCDVINNEKKFSPPKSLFNYGTTNGYNYHLKMIRKKLQEFSFEKGFRSRILNKNQKYSKTLCAIRRVYLKYSEDE